MVGNHDVGMIGAAGSSFYKALMIVIAGRIDTLAACIGKTARMFPSQKAGQPARKVTAGKVAVFCGFGPARHNTGGNHLIGMLGKGGYR